jgi:hypothetical protein
VTTSVRELKARNVDGQPFGMGRQLAGGRPVSVAALEAWSDLNALQLSVHASGQRGHNQISDLMAKAVGNATGENGLSAKPHQSP